jgi:NAD(P)-dependent dehydrogenase (short-subunit alcohol dehydrogenase family)
VDLQGKVALVTGGASGIGRATAERLAVDGAAVVVADVDETLGKDAAEACGGRFVAADVSEPAAWSALVAGIGEHEGGLDVACLNAGVTTGEGDLAALTDAQYRRIMGVNVDGVVFGVRAVLPAMTGRGGGAIVVTASMAGLLPFPPDPIYTVTKHAVVGLVRALGVALPPGVTINAICPGVVDTPLLGAEAKSMLEAVGYPLIPPSQIAEGVVAAVASGATGEAWVCQPGRAAERFAFAFPPGLEEMVSIREAMEHIGE